MEQITNKIEDAGPRGLGGWLVLVIIGLFITVFKLGYGIINNYIPLTEQLHLIPDQGFLKMVIYSELIINILFVIYAIILLILLFNYSRFFPILIIAFYISNLVFVLGDYIIASQIPLLNQVDLKGDDYKEIIKSIIGTSIWVPYFKVSKRVKNTFIQ